MIEIENLKLDFPGRLNLFIDRLSVERGKILTIIGPNGSGKTTLLNIIGLFRKPDAGRLEIFGTDIFKIKDKLAVRRKISFIFSQPYLFSETVQHNVSLPLRLRGIRDHRAVDQMLDLFKISHLKSCAAATLSQGEKHRVALARAFVAKPELVLLDEPFLSLDSSFKESLINDLRRIIKLNKITAIFVTQDHLEALALCDTIAVMINGRILQRAAPEEIFIRPGSKEIADFVGIETIVEGPICRKEDNLCFIKVKDKMLEAVSEYGEGDNVFVCIRPEDVSVSLPDPQAAEHTVANSARNRFKAVIVSLEPWRLEYKLGLNCGFNLVAFVTSQSVKSMNLTIGKEVVVSFKATALHVIRRESRNDTVSESSNKNS